MALIVTGCHGLVTMLTILTASLGVLGERVFSYTVVQWPKIHFVSPAHEKLFMSDERVRAWFAQFDDKLRTTNRKHLVGEVRVIEHGTFSLPYECGWMSKYRPFLPKHGLHEVNAIAPMVIPDGWSFQHFVDGTLPKIAQAYDVLRKHDVPVLIEAPRDPITLQMIRKLGLRHKIYAHPGYMARKLYFGCVAPPMHPVLWQRMSRLLGVDRGAARLHVVWLRRSASSAHNGGRMVLNNAEVESALRSEYGHQFRVFSGSNSLEESMLALAHARVVIGAHGGAFTNLLFAPNKTIVVEFMPVNQQGRSYMPYAAMMTYHQASMLSQPYWRIPVVSPTSNFEVDVNQLLQLLRRVSPPANAHPAL